jgi:hypothetical protein
VKRAMERSKDHLKFLVDELAASKGRYIHCYFDGALFRVNSAGTEVIQFVID